jgi:hypothetical protein
MVVPTGPALTRLSYGVRGQDVEVATLSGSPRPTRGPRLRGGFLSPDLSNPWVQTSSGSCTKPGTPRQWGGDVVLPFNIGEGRESLPASGVPAARLRHAHRKVGAAPVRGRCGTQELGLCGLEQQPPKELALLPYREAISSWVSTPEGAPP